MKDVLTSLISSSDNPTFVLGANSPAEVFGNDRAEAVAEATAVSAMRVLLVSEDCARVGESLRALVADNGSGAPIFHFDCAVDLAEGVEAEAEVILVDVRRGELRGLEVVRLAARAGRVPVIALLNAPDAELEAAAVGAGAAECLHFELGFEVFSRAIRGAQRVHEVQAQLRAAQGENSRLKAAFENAGVGIAMARHSLDVNGEAQAILSFANSAFERITGYDREEIVGRDAQLLLGQDSDARTAQALRHAVAAEKPLEATLLSTRKDGTPFWNALQISPVRDPQGRVTDWVSLISDVSAQVEAEQSVRHSQQNLAAAQRLTHLGSWFYELDAPATSELNAKSPAPSQPSEPLASGTLFWSEEVFRIFGLEPDGAKASRELYLSLIHPDDRGRAWKLDEIFAAGGDFEARYRIVRPDGQERTVQVRAAIEHDGEGAPRRVIGTIADISERWRAESRAREARRYLQLVMRHAPVVIWALNGEGIVTFIEGHALQKLGNGVDTHVGRSFFEIYQDHPAIFDLARRALSGEEVGAVVELPGLFFDVQYLSLRDEAGAPCGAVGMAYDITERRTIERAFLFDSQKRLGAVINSVPMLIWATDLDGIFTLSQGRALETLGLKQDEAVGQSLFAMYGQDSPIAERVRRALRGEVGQETFEVGPHFYEVHCGPSRDENGQINGAVGMSYVVTERVLAQRELEQSEARFNSIVVNASGMVYRFHRDLEGRINFLFVSDGCQEIYGLDADYIRAHPTSILQVVAPESLEEFHSSIRESEHTLEPWTWEGRILRLDGEWRWVRAQSRPVRQEDGSTLWDGLVMDVTQTHLAQAEILKSRRALDEAQQLAHIGSFEWNLENGEIRWSDELFRIFGFEPGDFEPTLATLFELIEPSERQRVRGHAVQLLRAASSESLITSITRRDGTVRWLQTHTRTEVNQAGRAIYIVGSAQDVTESVEASRLLQNSEERYALAAQGANDGLWDWNLELGCIYFSPRWQGMLGYAEGEIGDDPEEWLSRVHADDLERLRTLLNQHLLGESAHFECEYRVTCADGSTRWMLCRALAITDKDGQAKRIAGSQTDITTRKNAEAQLSRNAFYDTLTGLPNRTLFLDRLERTLSRARRNADYTFATLFLDIDRFKKINDSLGHMAGDELLIQAAARFATCLRPGDTVARLGGDEFALLIDDIHDDGDVPLVADRIQKALELPFQLEGKEIFVTVSIGIAPYRGGGEESPSDLLRNADSAMYRAKGLGRARYETFDSAMHQRAIRLLELETDLWRAIERKELCLHYQPIVSLHSGQICGYEALVRWNHPTRGLVPPGDFIPIAEENGLIVPLGWWVLEEACRQARAWSQMRSARFPGERAHFMSVNLSSKQFSQPGIVEQVRHIVESTGVDPNFLTLEITESVIMEHNESASATLRALKAMGIHLSMDDFGTGYSSLSYLHRFSLDTLKIDRSFISQMRLGARDGEIVNTILALAVGLNMNVVAEGVETADQLSGLRRMECGFAQGFLLSKPLPCAEIEQLWNSAPHW